MAARAIDINVLSLDIVKTKTPDKLAVIHNL